VLRILRTRRWVGFTVLAAVFVVAFIRLAFWQVSRLHEREAANAVEQSHLSATPLTYAELVARTQAEPGFATDQEWQAVTVHGTWDAAHELLVRNRDYQGSNGYEVVTPLVPADGPAVLVDRGWVPAGHTTDRPDSVPAAQPGPVTVTGRLQPSEPERPADGLPTGQVLSMADSTLSHGLPYAALPGHLVLSDEQPRPAAAPSVQPDPTLDDGPHLSYAVQWVLFAVVAVCGWWVYLRRLALEDEPDVAEPSADGAELPIPEPSQERPQEGHLPAR
jgi:cytochrome oxidase assembly protein ShyY1